MDLGRVSVLGGGRGQQYNFLKMKLSDDFRRAGIGACLEGEWDELWCTGVPPLCTSFHECIMGTVNIDIDKIVTKPHLLK